MHPVWDSLEVELNRLLDEKPCPLTRFPDTRVDDHRLPPFGVQLAPWALSVAEELHARFGDDVELTVGALSFPPRGARVPVPVPDAPLGDSAELTVELNGPLSIRSGHTGRHGLRLTNHTDQSVTVRTGRHLTAVVVDPATHHVVGGFAGAHRGPYVRFKVPSGATRVIPLLVGTASLDRALGYAIPPGEWALRTVVALDDGRSLLTPALPFTVTE
ncbi:hypothetical protein DI005_31025 [Prauserella sp. PE36]|uniref:DUF4469 domain-containing protein n=1 Tax=Prauserella endophytica TaxID=1592324 RepID=A0ABY2SBJ5_9PSEU|nr:MULTISPECIES: hypothetical protein [Prauserella]RBM12887.1 hypothetical protein DI005_31025 [Prauserella sp. PE36]TKG73197.1 hypothetical protein FCN18_00975 [Prauserella endophytica]